MMAAVVAAVPAAVVAAVVAAVPRGVRVARRPMGQRMAPKARAVPRGGVTTAASAASLNK